MRGRRLQLARIHLLWSGPREPLTLRKSFTSSFAMATETQSIILCGRSREVGQPVMDFLKPEYKGELN